MQNCFAMQYWTDAKATRSFSLAAMFYEKAIAHQIAFCQTSKLRSGFNYKLETNN
jgi:hypothetical protein